MADQQQPDWRFWSDFFANPNIVIRQQKVLRPDDAVFTIGSCFALEIRRALAEQGFTTYPDYAAVPYERGQEIFDKIPPRIMPAHYDTFTMRQEIETALGAWPDRARGYWTVRDAPVNEMLKTPEVTQDPYRKLTYATTPERLAGLADRITAIVREGLDRARVVVITLGLTEVWQHTETGKYICRPPDTGYGGGHGLAKFKLSTFMENYENMRALLDLLFATYPDKHVILSVSPVRLEATYSKVDVGTANLESKSILRAVAGQIARDYPEQVTYYPSFEMAMAGVGSMTGTGYVFEADGRHVQPSFIDMVTKAFLKRLT